MYSLLAGLKQTGTSSALGLKSALGSQSSSVIELIQTALIHQHYTDSGGRRGPLGLPTSDLLFGGTSAIREYRGGGLQVRENPVDGPTGTIVQAFTTTTLSVRFLGFRCVEESKSDELTDSDEPYFVIAVDTLAGAPIVKKFGPFEGTNTGDEIGVGDLVVVGVAPNPLAIKVVAYEHDHGDPDETAKKLQEKFVELAKEGEKLASGADSASGAGVGPAAGAGTLAGIAAGPFGALIAVGIVSVLDLGDDFIGQDVALAFQRAEQVTDPPSQGTFRGNPFNAHVDIDGGDEGHYELFFDVHLTTTTTS